MQAARRAGVGHVVFISVVGADRIPVVSGVDRGLFGYFAMKLAAERVVADSGVPWTTLRATQFHDLILKTAGAMAKLPVLPVPRFSFQPVETEEVATRTVELALGPPAGLVPDLAGPKVSDMAELLRSYLRASGKRRLLLRVRLPGRAAAGRGRRRQPGSRSGGGPPDVGGVPGGAGGAGEEGRSSSNGAVGFLNRGTWRTMDLRS